MKRHRPFWRLRLSLEVLTLLLVISTLYLAWETRRASQRATDDARQQIRVQTWLEMEKRYDSREMDRATARLAKQLDPYNSTNRDSVDGSVLDLFNDIGTLYKKDMIDTDLTDSSFSYDVNRWWVAAQPYIQDVRKSEGNNPDLYKEFEYLAGQFHSEDEKLTDKDIKEFLAVEKITFE